MASLLCGGCRLSRPIHPMRLAGFPGAPIEAGLFPLEAGRVWKFEGRDESGPRTLALSLEAAGDGFLLRGPKGAAPIALRDGFLEIQVGPDAVDRPLKLAGRVGDSWRFGSARATVFGYDEIRIGGRTVRALVTAVDRDKSRDLYWFVRDVGWVRLRTEREGRAIRDVRLVALPMN